MVAYFQKTMKNGQSWATKQWGDQIFIPRYIAQMEKSQILNSVIFLFTVELQEYHFSGGMDKYEVWTVQRTPKPVVELTYKGLGTVSTMSKQLTSFENCSKTKPHIPNSNVVSSSRNQLVRVVVEPSQSVLRFRKPFLLEIQWSRRCRFPPVFL